MNILVIGSGGREHAISWKLAQSPLLTKLYVAPGNPGMKEVAEIVHIGVSDFEKLGEFALEKNIDLIIVGPEVPLVEGIKDYFLANEQLSNIGMVGPDKIGAQLEGSKDFSKNFMEKYNIPTASYRTFTKDTLQEGLAYLDTHTLPIVLKADGLAAGKGVIIAEDLQTAKDTLVDMLANSMFGDASSRVVVEQFLTGIEASCFVLSDGDTYKILPVAKDYKRIGEGDTGPNTGGMGAISPVPFADKAFMDKVEARIIIPTVNGLKAEGIKYVGFIFVGLIKVGDDPYVIEYNARMGDPETEVVFPRITSDVVALMAATANGTLASQTLTIDPRTATTIMLVSGGYPADYSKGFAITGIEKVEDVKVFHAGTSLNANNELVNTGGRVLALTAFGKDIAEALAKSNQAAKTIQWEGKNYRTDIGFEFL
jgi:phosphoribosylamine--glycine ligase